MRRFIVSLCLALFGVGSLLAAPVPRNAAELVAKNVFLNRHPGGLMEAHVLSTEMIRWEGMPVIHAVNFREGGFVLVSADDRARPILGICHSGIFDPSVKVPGFDFMLEEWSREIHHIVRNRIPATGEIRQEWARYMVPQEWLTASAAPMPLPVVVAPLMSTTWNQGCYYNANCPVDAGGSCSRAWTGCGATAMSQCMKFHSWPPTGFGSASYVHGLYGAQSANFGAATYTFASMPNNVTAANPQVAQLMYHAGVALSMNYGTTESTCFFSDLEMSFKSYFRYSLKARSVSKLLYTDPQWDVVLRTELDAGRIIPYNGSTHIWVCDGYQTGPDLYHMNWGWGGTYNGYYAHNNLNPGSLTFSTVSCITGLKPVGQFEVESDSMTYGETGGPAFFEVSGDSNWTAAASAPWISLSVASGTQGYFKSTVTATANPGYSKRFAYVAVQRGSRRDTVWVRQDGITPRLNASPTPIAEGAAGGVRTVSITSDSNWVVTFADSWIAYSPGSGVGAGSVTLTIANNPGAGLRTGTIVFTRGSIIRTVTINQDGTSAFWCVPALGVPTAVGATNVKIKTINRTSGISEGYVLAPDSTILRRDSTYNLRVSFSGSVAPAVWIDWNQDGDFFDAAEAIVSPSGTWYPTFGGYKTTTVLVTTTALLGQTRMRVYVKTFSGGPTSGPCAITNVGDIEDYNVYIQPASVLPYEPFILAVDEVGGQPGLRWTWSGAQMPERFEVMMDEAGQWETLATVGGRESSWQLPMAAVAGRYQVVGIARDGSRTPSNVVEYAPNLADARTVLSPNPVAKGATVRLQFPVENTSATLMVFDASGRLIRQDHVTNASLCYLSTEGWTAGVYFLQINRGGRSERLRLVVE
ncbi:MAG: C10 family peptidase [Bacteroidia bacterium]